MRIAVSSPGKQLTDADIDAIEKDLEKIDRRLQGIDEVYAEVRINGSGSGAPGFSVTLELEYRNNHLIAKTQHNDMGQAVREAREEVLRQINNRSRGGHSSFAKRT